MFRNCLNAAFSDLRRSPIQSLIAIGGLAIGLTAALLTLLLGVSTFRYDSFARGKYSIYIIFLTFHNVHGDQ